MGKKLIITEKPSVARDFARVLNVSGNKNGYIENNDYVISWCYGHLVEMVYPESYDEKYKSWRLEDLPFLPKEYKYGVIENSKDQYSVVHNLLFREDIDTVYWAGDSGKEGQTIEENIRNYGGVREGMTELRVWIDSQTDDEIRRGINEARPMSDYERLGKSGIMRTIEDYSLGINFSRALSIKYGRLINNAAATKSYTAIALGRVMTCVLGMVVNREREIRNFVETPFYRVVGSFSENNFLGEWKAASPSKYVDSHLLYKENGFKKLESAEALIKELEGHDATVTNIEKTVSKKKAPLLFNLAELQSECSKLFKISPNQTLDIIQDLYERKLTTYPRTDARVLTTAVAKEIYKNIKGLMYFPPVANFAKTVLDEKRYAGIEKTSYTDDKKVTDHYAIIPTGVVNGLDSLSSLHKSVYELIVRRFLSIFFPPAEYKNIKVSVLVNNEPFFSSAKVLTEPGYLVVAGKKNDSEDKEGDEVSSKEELLKFVESANVGDKICVNGYEIKEGKTSPPKRYTSGNLILAMENAGNLIEDEELREQIKKTGIGTSATRGEILDKLVRIKYLNQNSKTQIISPENLGEMIYEVVAMNVPTLLNPEMTANWEMGLEGIINGTVDDVEYREKLENYIRKETNKMISSDLSREIAANINQFTNSESKGIATRKPLGLKCPVCGGELTTTSFGYGCSNYFNDEINCKFSVGEIAGVKIDEENFKKLITDGATDVIEGFKGKNKNSFSARLKLSENEEGKKEIAFDFEGVKDTVLEDVLCPDCGGKILVRGNGWMCETFSTEPNAEGKCRFYVRNMIASQKIDESIFKTLLSEGRSQTIRGFKSKNGNKFDACLVMKKNDAGVSEVSFDFDNVEDKIVKDVTCPVCGGPIIVTSFGFACKNHFATENKCYFSVSEIASKKLSEANIKELITDGRTKTIRGFKSKSKKSFDACLVLKTNEEGKKEIAFDFENVEAKEIKDVKCPVCGGAIVVTPFGYGCKNYNREDPSKGCNFNIGSIAGVKLKEANIKELLQNEITSTIDGFKSKKGTKFSAKIALSKDESGKVTGCRFVFEDNDEVVKDINCPKCNGSIIKNRFGYKCANFSTEEGGCSFRISQIAGKMLSIEEVSNLITNKKTDKLSGFTSKTGNPFDAALKFDENFNIVFDFES